MNNEFAAKQNKKNIFIIQLLILRNLAGHEILRKTMKQHNVEELNSPWIEIH